MKNPARVRAVAAIQRQAQQMFLDEAESSLETIVKLRDARRVDPAVRLKAAESILDRAFGKPSNALELSGPEGGPVQTIDVGALRDLPPDQVAGLLDAVRALKSISKADDGEA